MATNQNSFLDFELNFNEVIAESHPHYVFREQLQNEFVDIFSFLHVVQNC